MAAKYNDNSADSSNVSDMTIELSKMLHLIEDNENIPLVSLEEAVNPLVPFIPELEQMISIVKKNRNIAKDSLTTDESSSIFLYTIKWKPINKSFHVILNTTLETRNQTLLKPWFRYLKLIMTALNKLPSNSTRLTVYHAVQLNLIAQYPVGRIFVWWGFTLCTMSLNVFNNEDILGQNGARTLFIIDSHSGKSVGKYSFYPKEQEVLLPSACRFHVIGCFDAGNGLHIIHLKEIQPKHQLTVPVRRGFNILLNKKSTMSSLEKPNPIMLRSLRSSSVSPPTKRTSTENIPKRQSLIEPIQNLSGQSTIPKQISVLLQRINPKVQKSIEALLTDPKLTTLDLSRLQISDQEAKAIAYALQQNKTLTTLDLQHNLIRPQGAQSLANALKENTTLTTISLENNQISDQGTQYFANALLQNKTLTTLNLRSNQIRPQGIQHLANALQQNRKLTTINLRSNMISNLGTSYLANALQHNQTLTILNLANNRITAKGAQSLATALQQNKTLTILDLEDNEIGSQGVQYLINALQQNKTLTMLNLKGNQIGIEGKRYIMEVAQKNPALNIVV
ncbi:unnamed protein product [Rotaria sordida]|uniref:NAD(P)(+)--arginine ADP-ribosyltransferase n=1 Tax=Rotaria sordida TaxID=392033 RepID=A0A813V0L3_9BILA|nr:unnamed protein product [Rotaria sordida]